MCPYSGVACRVGKSFLCISKPTLYAYLGNRKKQIGIYYQITKKKNGEILVLVQKNAEVESPNNDDLAEIGLLATVRDVLRTTHLGVQMLVELRYRVQFDGLSSTEPYLAGNYSELPEEIEAESGELIAESIAYLDQYVETLGEAR